MSVDKVDNSGRNAGLYSCGAGIAGGAAGGLAGWNSKPFLKDGAPTDAFIKKAVENMEKIKLPAEQEAVLEVQKAAKRALENTKTVEEYIDVFYNYAIKGLGNDVDLIKQSLGVAQDVPEILGVDADKKFFTDLVDAGCIEDVQIAVKESLKRQFSGKTLEEIKATAKTKEDLASKNIAKVLFEEFWDSDKKENINSNDAYVEAFKKAAKSIQGKTALIFGAVGAAVLGLGTYLCIGGKKEK